MAVPTVDTPFITRTGPYIKCDLVFASVLEYIRDHGSMPPSANLRAGVFTWTDGATTLTSTDPVLTELFTWALYATDAISGRTIYTPDPPRVPAMCFREDIGGRGLAYMLIAIARGELVQNHGEVPWVSYTGELVTWRDGVVVSDGHTCKYNAAPYIVEKLVADLAKLA